MGSLDRRIEDLERRFSETTERSETSTHFASILDELAHLRQSCAPGLRGGVPIKPENLPRKILGPGYTRRQLLELAVRRTVEAGKVPAECSQDYLKYLCGMSRKNLDEVMG